MKKSETKIIIIASSILFFIIVSLLVFGGKDCPKCENKIITKEIIKEVKIGNADYNLLKAENKKLKNEINIRTQIMKIDDKGLRKGADGMGLCADAIQAAYYGRIVEMENITVKTEVLISNVNQLAAQKAKLLLQLKK